MPYPLYMGVRYFGDGTNYTSFAANGLVGLVGTARVVNSEWISAGSIKGAGLKPATEAAHGILEVPVWVFADESAANQQSVGFKVRHQRRMDDTVAPTLSLRLSTTTVDPGDNSKKYYFSLAYLWRKVNEDTTAAAQETLYVNPVMSTTAEGLVEATFTGIDLPDADDKLLYCKVTRVSDNVLDTIADTVELHGITWSWTTCRFGTAT